MELTEIHDRIAIVFNNLEHKDDTENSELLADLLKDLRLLIKQQGGICALSIERKCTKEFNDITCKNCTYYISESLRRYFKMDEQKLE